MNYLFLHLEANEELGEDELSLIKYLNKRIGINKVLIKANSSFKLPLNLNQGYYQIINKKYKYNKKVNYVISTRDFNSENINNAIKYTVIRYDNYPADLQLLKDTNSQVINITYFSKKYFDKITSQEKNEIKNQYYDKLSKLLKPKRLAHSISVASLSYDIALFNNLDAKKAYLAGLIHDCAKDIDKDYALKLMKKYNEEYLDIGEFAYHEFNAPIVAKEELNIDNHEIFTAIKYHATGNEYMSPLAMIIYVADKTDPLRGYDSTELIKSAKEDILQGFIDTLKANVEYFNAKGIDYQNRLTNKCIEHYLREDK